MALLVECFVGMSSFAPRIEGVELVGLKKNVGVQSSVWMSLDGFWLVVQSIRRSVWWSFQVKRTGELGAKIEGQYQGVRVTEPMKDN